jgi:hypothetical protein
MLEAIVYSTLLMSVLLIAVLHRTRYWWLPGGLVFACAPPSTAAAEPNLALLAVVLYAIATLFAGRILYARHRERAARESGVRPAVDA